MLSGKWTYRSYRNDDRLVGENAEAALGLIFGEGIFDFDYETGNRFAGGLGMGGGYALAITGEATGSGAGVQYAMIGLGIDGTPTEGWRYDYRCRPAFSWPNGVDQVPALLGTVIRVNAHGPDAPAGYTASFIAVRQTAPLRAPARRRSALTVGL